MSTTAPTPDLGAIMRGGPVPTPAKPNSTRGLTGFIPSMVRVGRCPECRGSGLLPGPDATGAQERCCWCDGSGAAAA